MGSNACDTKWQLLDKVDCLKVQGVARMEDVIHGMNEGYRAWGALKSVLNNRGFGIKAKRCLHGGVILPRALYGAEAWGIRNADRRKEMLPIHTLNYWTCSQWCPVSNWGCVECDIAHRRSVAVLCMLYQIRCNPVHPLNGALSGQYVPVRVAHRYTYAPPSCITSQSRRTFIPLSVSLWNDLANPVFNDVGLTGFKSRANVFLLA